MNVTKLAVIRLIVAFVAMLNGILTAKGINPIPFDETLVTETLSYLFDGVMVVWVWWKNAPVTKVGVKHHLNMVAEKILNKLDTEAVEEFSNGKGEEVDE